MSPRFRPSLATILVLLLASQLVATDLYLPALPQIASQFGGGAGPVQWTLTAFILAFGLAQLAVGWRADHFGRRPLLLWGLAAYVAAALMGALASGLGILVASRVLLGVATALCVIGARAVIRDRYDGAAGMGIMARSMSGMGAIGVLSPLAGGLVTQALGWHWTLALVAGFGALAWLAVYHGLEETRVPLPGVVPLGYLAILRHRQFLVSSLLAGTSFSGAMCFLLLSPFVFIRDLGMSRLAYGAVPALCTLFFLAGTVWCRRLLRRHPVQRVVKWGALLSLAGGAGQVAMAWAGAHAAWALLLPQCVYMLGHGIHQPCGQGGAVAPFPRQAGRAAAASGLVITSVAFFAGQLAAHSALPAAATLVVAMACISCGVGLLAFGCIERAYQAGADECALIAQGER